MTRKFWVKVARHEEFGNRYRISLRPFRFDKAPSTMRSLTFDSQRIFPSELAAQRQVFATFGRVVKFKRNAAGELEGSFRLDASPLW